MQDKTRANTWWDNMIINSSMVNEWIERKLKDCLNLTLVFFGGNWFLVVVATNSLLTISLWMFLELSLNVNGQESEYLFIENA